jgi:hypothetical protein
MIPPNFPPFDSDKIPPLSPDVIAVAVRLQRLKADGFCGSVEVNFNRRSQIRDLNITSREEIGELLSEIAPEPSFA